MNSFKVTAFPRMGGMIMRCDVIPIIVTAYVCIYSTDILEGYTMYTTSNRMNRILSYFAYIYILHTTELRILDCFLDWKGSRAASDGAVRGTMASIEEP